MVDVVLRVYEVPPSEDICLPTSAGQVQRNQARFHLRLLGKPNLIRCAGLVWP